MSAPDMNHPQRRVFSYLQVEVCGVSLSTQAGGSNTSPGEVGQDVAVERLLLVCRPRLLLHGVSALRLETDTFYFTAAAAAAASAHAQTDSRTSCIFG